MTSRPLVTVSLFYVAGILGARLLLEDAFLAYLMLSMFFLAGLVAHLWRLISVSLFTAAVLVVVFMTGAAAFWFASSPSPHAAAGTGILEYAGQTVTMKGTVVEEPRHEEAYTVYRVRSEIVDTGSEKQAVHGDLQVRIYHSDYRGENPRDKALEEGVLGENAVYWYGERLLLEGEIVEAKGRRNPGGFDYQFYLKTLGIDALMYLQTDRASSLGYGEVNWMTSSAFSLRAGMIEGIEANLPSPHAELLTAVLFGQRQRLPADIQESFHRAGTGHLMAVSGLHIGLVAALILGLWKILKLKGAAPIILAVILLFAYAYLTGMRPAALRAALMFSMGLVALLVGRKKDFPSAIALAALVTLLYNPLLLFSIGFQLSYSATLSIFYLYPFLAGELLYRFPPYLKQLVGITLAAQLGVLPLTAYYFQHLPLLALFFNILLLPVMAVLVGVGLAGSVLYLISPFLSSVLHLSSWPILEYVLRISALADASWVYREVTPPGIAWLVLFYSGLALAMVAYYHWRRRNDESLEQEKEQEQEKESRAENTSKALPAESGLQAQEKLVSALKNKVSPLLFQLASRENFSANLSRCKAWSTVNKGKIAVGALLIGVIIAWAGAFGGSSPGLNVYFLDVGQGAAAYLETSCGFNILIDSGGEPPYVDPDKQGDIGEKVLLPFLRYRGADELDLVVISHPHEDHFAGFIPVMERIQVNCLMISPVPGQTDLYAEMLAMAEYQEIPVKEVREGDNFTLGEDLSMEVLLPPLDGLYRGTGCDLNNNSVVMRVIYEDVEFMFTGDIEEEAISDLLHAEVDISADVLLIPHHGGNFLSADPFLEAVSPRVAVIQVGRNPFGHPHPDVTEALENADIITYRNDLHGAIILHTDGKHLWQETMLTPN